MQKPILALTAYQDSPKSLNDLLDKAHAFEKLEPQHRVLIKPNLVGWDPDYPIAPFGVYTTSRLVEDMVILLKDYGIRDITIGEGSVRRSSQDTAAKIKGTDLIFQALGYRYLAEKYSVKLVDFFNEPFESVDYGDFSINYSRVVLSSDYVINMPVLKTHNQTKLSLGLKNLKGCIDLKSRRLCHHATLSLDYFCSLFVEAIRPSLTVLDGIYGLEKGPYYLGTAHRMNLIAASQDPLGVDVLGAYVSGYNPKGIEHIKCYAERNNRLLALENFTLKGPHPDTFKRSLKCDFVWREDNTGPKNWDKLGVSGISVPKYDQTICTGCSGMYNPLLMLLTSAWYNGQTFDGIEVLTGKKMSPSPEFDKTILFGNCMIKKHRNNPDIKKAIYVKGCPVKMSEIIRQLKTIGIEPDIRFFSQFRESLARRYDGIPDFDPRHYFMPGAVV